MTLTLTLDASLTPTHRDELIAALGLLRGVVAVDVAPAPTAPPPTARRWAIWQEGYRVQEVEATARYLGSAVAPTFEAACAELCGTMPDYDRTRNTLWGCGLFPTEARARQFYG